MKNKKCAILFFGLTRTLGDTIDSLKTNLFTPLHDNLIDYDIFIHTYKIYGKYNNMWSGEKTDNYNNEDVETLLNPKYFIFDDQQIIIDSINFDEYYKNLGNWGGNYTSEMTKYLIKNMCLALYSKKQITLLFDKHMNDYDYAIIIRPDTNLNNKININDFNELKEDNIIIPIKDWFDGCNDRICIGKPNVISYYGKLFDELKIYSETTSIISEKFLMDKLNEKSINIISKDIDYTNLRIKPSWRNEIKLTSNNKNKKINNDKILETQHLNLFRKKRQNHHSSLSLVMR
jgi:hypothetical protein